jgi:hypothetical protein
MRHVGVFLLSVTLMGAGAVATGAEPRAEASPPGLKIEHFDRDPGWEGFHNRLMPKVLPTITQDFGYSRTNFAGKATGEIGGRVCRDATPAHYAAKIASKTLNDKLSASGSFAVTATSSGTAVFFGWFSAQQPGGSGRPINSLGLDIGGERSGGRLAVRLINSANKSCGTFVTPFIPGKYRPTPIRNDGTRYAWRLDYDPDANGGQGRFQFLIKSNAAKPDEFEGKTFSVDLPPGFKKEGARFDRFGMMNGLKAGGTLTIHFDDLSYDGRTEDFSQDPGWEGSHNRGTFPNLMPAGAHDFGYSATSFAGGARGEVGGVLWRGGKYAYYADRVGPLSLEDRLEAGGRVVMVVGGVDADIYLGWFNSANKDQSPVQAGPFLGVHVGGPTRVGHYFQPALATAKGNKGHANGGPLLTPGKVYRWSLVYDPAAEGGQGAVQVSLDNQSVKLSLRRGFKQGALFDRFGLFNPGEGGQIVKIYLDDLKYTASRPTRGATPP